MTNDTKNAEELAEDMEVAAEGTGATGQTSILMWVLIAVLALLLVCACLSLALLVGLGLNYLYGFWQADPFIGLVIVGLLVREGYETLKEEKLCTCCGVPSAPASED